MIVAAALHTYTWRGRIIKSFEIIDLGSQRREANTGGMCKLILNKILHDKLAFIKARAENILINQIYICNDIQYILSDK